MKRYLNDVEAKSGLESVEVRLADFVSRIRRTASLSG